jgi:hypothetical protein
VPSVVPASSKISAMANRMAATMASMLPPGEGGKGE